MKDLFTSKKVILVGGPGGVGKTTLAASLGIALATQGYRTIVLTVDPAKRLAQALGFEDFKEDLQKVTIPGAPEAMLHATMLDTERYFDKIIDRFAAPGQKEKILNNPMYRTMVDSLGGTHEYAAMERLLEIANDSAYDKIVVDTPPTQNAVDLLSAPQRLADFMDNSVLKWFQGPKPLYFKLFQTGTRVAMKIIQGIFGAEFIERFSTFMSDIEGMQAGFRKRNLEVLDLMRSPKTAFLLVTFPSEVRYLESVAFQKTLRENRIPLSGLVLNRLEPACPGTLSADAPVSQDDRKLIDDWLTYAGAVYLQQKYWVDAFNQAFRDVPRIPVQKRPGDVHDVETLSQLGAFLVS